MRNNFHIKIFLFVLAFLYFPVFALADALGQQDDFYIDSSYDFSEREEITASLRFIGDKINFYIDDYWWGKFGASERDDIEEFLDELSREFNDRIYPIITADFGYEWKPGIDDSDKITVLFHPMRQGAAGYFRPTNEYSKLQYPESNEREMIHLSTDYIENPLAKSFLAHEFIHLITFNQKDRKRGVEEEIWLNEARAEYAPTLLGYDSEFTGSNLENRVQVFSSNFKDSITEWKGTPSDYGALNLFTQYLVQQYGKEILSDSLKSSKVGIESLNYALDKNGVEKNIEEIFQDWTIAVLVNDCSLGKSYCYKNNNLSNLKITPSLNFLPLVAKTTLRIEDSIKDWSGGWYKLMGGKGTLSVEFDGFDEIDFSVHYLSCKKTNECFINELVLDGDQEGKITVVDFGQDYSFLTLVISTHHKTSDFGADEFPRSFVFKASTEEKDETIQQLLDRIAFLQSEIAKIQAQIDAILANQTQEFSQDLYYGMINSNEVSKLQQFLKSQGSDVYPEGLVTGNFLQLTKNAVIRFQEKYSSQILSPLGLTSGTGFFGEMTRKVANSVL